MLGYSRDGLCRFKDLYDAGGEVAFQELTPKKPVLANRTPPETEALIVALSLEQPAFGQIRIANEIRKRGYTISPAGIGGAARIGPRHSGVHDRVRAHLLPITTAFFRYHAT